MSTSHVRRGVAACLSTAAAGVSFHHSFILLLQFGVMAGLLIKLLLVASCINAIHASNFLNESNFCRHSFRYAIGMEHLNRMTDHVSRSATSAGRKYEKYQSGRASV